LIERVVLILDATAPDGLAAELYGDLAMVLLLAERAAWEPEAAAAATGKLLTLKHKKRPGTCVPGRQLTVVAGARNHLNLLFDARGLNRPIP
jgi:hypothetical protein